MVGLSIDDNDHNDDANEATVTSTSTSTCTSSSSQHALLATKAAEAELEKKIERLQQELLSAQEALDRLQLQHNSNSINDKKNPLLLKGQRKARSSSSSSTTTTTTTSTTTEAPSASVAVVTVRPPGKSGYLFRWLDRAIGWGGTKWSLRFVTLEGGRLAYYGSHTEAAINNTNNNNSGFSFSSSPRYVLTLTNCAVRDEGWKRNRRHASWKKKSDPPLEEPGAYFFVFSVYHRSSSGYGKEVGSSSSIGDSTHSSYNSNDVADICPLLRFSTPSLAEKNQWVQLIAEACAWCETDDFVQEEYARASEFALQQQQQLLMSQAMPEAKNSDGTLPPLIFAPPPFKPPARRPSFHKKTPSQVKLFKSAAEPSNGDVEQMIEKKGYPPSRPMHRSAAPSYLSFDAPPQTFRGLFNLAMIILLVSNFRLLLGAISQHGFVVTRLLRHLKEDVMLVQREISSYHRHPDIFDTTTATTNFWEDAPFVFGVLLLVVFVVCGFSIEYLLAHDSRSSTKRKNTTTSSSSNHTTKNMFGRILHLLNAHAALAIPTAIVWKWIHQPPVGAILIVLAIVTWMKLLSYAHANEDYRIHYSQSKKGRESLQASVAVIENLDPSDCYIQYPQNVTLGNLLYFWCAPSLTYQIVFPKYPKVRVWVVLDTLLRLLVSTALFTFLVAQVVAPALENLVNDLEDTRGTITAKILAEYWLKLAVGNTYLWLLFFYIYFHLFLNLLAELQRFGDRVFYRAWWNASEVSAYWRLWNTPVHYWLIRHVYFPCLRLKISRNMATFVVFLISAVLHEVCVSVPFHMIRPWCFLGMMMQIPLVGITKFLARRWPGSSLGNIIFWISFCVVGQPMAILLYTVDYQYRNHHSLQAAAAAAASGGEGVSVGGGLLEILYRQDECRVMWKDQCLIH